LQKIPQKRGLKSWFLLYDLLEVNMEVQFAQNRTVSKLQVADFTTYIRDLLINIDGEFRVQKLCSARPQRLVFNKYTEFRIECQNRV
jgi:hypothetical protein